MTDSVKQQQQCWAPLSGLDVHKQPHNIWPMRTHLKNRARTIGHQQNFIPTRPSSRHNTHTCHSPRTPTPLHHHQQHHHRRPTSSSTSSSGSRSTSTHPHHRPRELPSVISVRSDLPEDHSLGHHTTRLSPCDPCLLAARPSWPSSPPPSFGRVSGRSPAGVGKHNASGNGCSAAA